MKLKKGDIVTVRDFSYSRFVKDGELVDHYSLKIPRKEIQFVVVDVNVKTHPVSYQVDSKDCNNTIIQAVDSGIVGFIEERFLTLAKHEIVIDGKTVEISHESFLNLKKQLSQ